MNKKLYFKFSDNNDVSGVIMELDACMEWIKNDSIEFNQFELDDYEYTLKPVFLTDEEYNNLPEADI